MVVEPGLHGGQHVGDRWRPVPARALATATPEMDGGGLLSGYSRPRNRLVSAPATERRRRWSGPRPEGRWISTRTSQAQHAPRRPHPRLHPRVVAVHRPVPARRLRPALRLPGAHRAAVRLADPGHDDPDGAGLGLPRRVLLLRPRPARTALGRSEARASRPWPCSPTLLGIATVVHWDKFSHGHLAFWLWAGLYFTAPFLVLGGLARQHARSRPHRGADEPRIGAVARWAVGRGRARRAGHRHR